MRRALMTASLGRRSAPWTSSCAGPEVVGGSTQALMAARRQQVLQLAASLEDDGPLPGADALYRRAREAQAALDRHEKGVEGSCTAHLE